MRMVSWLTSMPLSSGRSLAVRSDAGEWPQGITAKRIISGEVLKDLNGQRRVMPKGLVTDLPASPGFPLILPARPLCTESQPGCCRPFDDGDDGRVHCDVDAAGAPTRAQSHAQGRISTPIESTIFPVLGRSARARSDTIFSAARSGSSGASCPPMSVLSQPGWMARTK